MGPRDLDGSRLIASHGFLPAQYWYAMSIVGTTLTTLLLVLPALDYDPISVLPA